MALGIYKPGQGYWVRVLTAVFAGILVLAGAGYAWQQAKLVPIPIEGYTVRLVAAEGEVQSSAPLKLLSPGGEAEVGSAQVLQVVTPVRPESGQGTILMSDPIDAPDVEGAAIDTAKVVTVTGPDGAESFRATIENAIAKPKFPPMYVQAGASLTVILLGAIVIFWLVGAKQKTAEFLINTDGEMRKVNWSTYREIKGSTIVVITAAFLIAAILFVIDVVFQWIFTAIDVLQGT